MTIMQHFRPEEQPIIKSALQYAEKVEEMYAPVLTPFLDPREQYIFSVVAAQQQVKLSLFGGDEMSERKRAIVSPDYFEPEIADYEMELIEVNYPDKFVALTHRNLLGSIMQTGIKREQLGDIRVEDRIQFVVTKQMAIYLQRELTKIKGAAVKLEIKSFDDMIQTTEHFQSRDTTLASLRLDAVVQALTKKSRAVAQKMIDAEHVKVNHTIITKTSFTVEARDLLSIKGYGRARVAFIGDRTKKDKIRVTLETLFN
ncbi:RNA-binding protein [Macrococcus hajekii]|uniref:RNA-binding protein n=1 Tax=Macrococcus hajekii TaxID=198482 RepID=A0A4R6BNI9_9STAP|nr:RNA-binding protein [Macrococcus hajekii]TDM03272.1 RNA-binding protein [Macrococcus hajekii]GGA97490.1 S4 RNA-binding protein [Macrococcus hajekii]